MVNNNNEQPVGLQGMYNAGQEVPVVPMNIPEPVKTTPTTTSGVPKTGFVNTLSKHDADDDSEFEPWFFDEENIFETSPFLGINFKKIGHALGNAGRWTVKRLGEGGSFYVRTMVPGGSALMNAIQERDRNYIGSSYMGVELRNFHPGYAELLRKAAEADVLYVPTRILTNQVYHDHLSQTDSNYTGNEYSHFEGLDMEDIADHQAFFDGLSPEEQEMYSDFLGINFKKIGKAIGGAVKAVGKGIGAAAKGVAKAGAFAGKTVGKVGVFAGKTLGKGAQLIGKGALAAGKLALKVAASQAGLDGVTNQSNGEYYPQGGVYSGVYNPDFDPDINDPGEYDNETGDQNSYDEQRNDLVDDEDRAQTAQELIANALEPEHKTSIWLWVALAAVLGLGFYLIKYKKHKI